MAAAFKFHSVMPGLVPGIHVLLFRQDVDGRDKPGHDDVEKQADRRAGP
jgi:hypothetical protein